MNLRSLDLNLLLVFEAILREGSVARARGLADPDLEHFRRSLIAELSAPRGFDPPALAQRIDVAPDVARSVLVRLRTAGLAEDDGARPPAFARTAKADWILEHTNHQNQDDQ